MDLNNISTGTNLLPEPKKLFWKSLWFKITVLIILLLVLGAGIALASRIWDPLWSPFRPSPEEVLQGMFENMKKVSSAHTEADFSMEAGGASMGSISFKLSDDSNSSNPKEPKSKGSMNLALGMQGMQFSADLSYVLTGNDFYLKLDKIPAIPMLPIDTSILKGKWIRIPDYPLDSEKMVGILDIVENFSAGDIMFIKEELKDEKVGDKMAYHYIVGLKENKLKDLLNQLMGASSLGSYGGIDMTDVEEIAAKLGNLEMEYWIGKKDKMLYRSKFDAKMTEDGETVSFSLDMVLSGFNEPVIVTAPADYVEAEEITNSLMGSGPLGTARIKARNVGIKADLSSLRASAELHAMDNNNSYSGFCKSVDFERADENVKTVGSYILCNDAVSSWAACAQLNPEESNDPKSFYYCVDSTGMAKEISGVCKGSWKNKSCPK